MNDKAELRSDSSKRNLGCLAVFVLILLAGWATIGFGPIGQQIRAFGEAEQIVNDFVVPFKNELTDEGATATALLNLPRYAELKKREIAPNTEEGELVRFHINDTHEIGVTSDYLIIWHVSK